MKTALPHPPHDVRAAALCLSSLLILPALLVAEWQPLFNGKDLDGWHQLNGQATYTVEDGCIVGTTVADQPNSFLATNRDYGNFILELEFLVDNGMNSGVQIRSQSTPDYRDGRVHGYQVEIDADAPDQALHAKEPLNRRADGSTIPAGTAPRRWTGGIYDEARRGWLCDLSNNEAGREAFRPGEWNLLRVEAIGPLIRTWINGVPTARLRDAMTPSGFIALQVHAIKDEAQKQIRWRNIRIRDLGPNDGSAPGGAIVLFDGKSLDQWGRLDHGHWLEPDGPAARWSLTPEGFLEVVPEAGSLLSHRLFADVFLHLEFRLLSTPTNGGVYLMSRYEIDINESHGNAAPSLGAFSNLVERKAPLLQAARPIGEWQTLEVDFRAPRLDGDGRVTEEARASVWINGILVQDDVVLGARKGAASRLGEAAQGGILLQEHGTPYQFRNIWVLEQEP